MYNLNLVGLIAVFFTVETTVTDAINGLETTYPLGHVFIIDKGMTNLVVDNSTPVACMDKMARAVYDSANIFPSVIQGFCANAEAREPVAV